MTSPIGGPPFAAGGCKRGRPSPQVLVVGLGSRWRNDDGVGLEVARSVAERGIGRTFPTCRILAPIADPLDLLLHWDGVELAVVVDATRSGSAPGKISRIELEQPDGARSSAHASTDTRPARRPPDTRTAHGPSSTHGIGLAGVLRLGRSLGRAPARTVIIGVEGQNFGQGSHLSPAVAAAVDGAAAAVIAEVREGVECA